jgi:hypothetical protein
MIKHRPLQLAAQLYLLQKLYPAGHGAISHSLNGRRLRWFQEVRPHVLGGRYAIELRLVEQNSPEVLVHSPDIRALAGGRKLPHRYAEVDGLPSLCLWWLGDWKSWYPVATTVIPWAGEWFWFYEYWLITGEWLGGGTHPVEIVPPSPPSSPNSEQNAA